MNPLVMCTVGMGNWGCMNKGVQPVVGLACPLLSTDTTFFVICF